MTVSIASAMVSGSRASAPVIRDFPDIIIGDEATSLATSAQTFVFPDALDLRTFFTSDNDSTSVSVKWSFMDPADHIQINGVNGAVVDPINPGPTERVTTNDLDPAQVDGDPFTITFRNKYFSPIGGPNNLHGPLSAFSDPLTSVSVIDTNLITLFASDGATYTAKNLTVYTVNNTSDGLSGGLTFTAERTPDFSTGATNSWTGTRMFGETTGSFQAVSGSGLCLISNAAAATPSDQQWTSPEQYVDLKDNTLYRVRISMNTTQATVGQIPFWRFGYINNKTVGPTVNQNYGGQRFFLSASGGAAGVGTPNGRTVFEVWIAPNPMSTPQWRDPSTGAFAPLYAGFEDFGFDFTMFDSNNAIGSNTDSGSVCLSSVTVDSVPATSLLGTGTTVYSTPLSSSTHKFVNLFGTNTGNFVGSTAEMTLQKPTAANQAPGFTLQPGQGGPANNNIEFPVLWEGDVLYSTEADLRVKSPGTGDPIQLITMVFNQPTNEQISDDYSWRGNAGYMTKVAAPTTTSSTYRNWWYSNNVSTSAATINGADVQRFQWLLQLFNNGALNLNKGGDTTVVEAVRVVKYTVPVYPN